MSFQRNSPDKRTVQSSLSHLKSELVYPMENMTIQSESVQQQQQQPQTRRPPPRSAVDAFEASLGPRKNYTKVIQKPQVPLYEKNNTVEEAKPSVPEQPPALPAFPSKPPSPPAIPTLPRNNSSNSNRLSTPPAIPNSPRPPKNNQNSEGKVNVLNPIYAGVACAGCEKAIDGHQVVNASDKTWHTDCFTCSKCGDKLVDKNYYEKNGQILCERDYKDVFSMHCDFCGEPIENQAILALDKYYHEGHFCCVICKMPFEDQEGFMVNDGKPYCQEDYMKQFGKKCGGCQQYINGEYIDAMGKHWHKGCFVCTDCKNPFQGGYLQRDNKPYCEEHFNNPTTKKSAPPPLKPKPALKPTINNKPVTQPEIPSKPMTPTTTAQPEKPSRGSKQQAATVGNNNGNKVCHTCHEAIDGPCASALDHDYHVHHFQCHHCSRPLSSRVPGMWQSDKNGELICKMCAFKQS